MGKRSGEGEKLRWTIAPRGGGQPVLLVSKDIKNKPLIRGKERGGQEHFLPGRVPAGKKSSLGYTQDQGGRRCKFDRAEGRKREVLRPVGEASSSQCIERALPEGFR